MTTMLSLDPQKIKTCNAINPRKTNGSYKDLVASIKAYGILEAPAVRKVSRNLCKRARFQDKR